MQTFVVVAGILVFAFVIYNSFFKSSKAEEIKETEQEPSTGVATPTGPVFIEDVKPVQNLVSDEELPKAEVPIAEPVKEEVVEAVVQPEPVVEKEVKPKTKKVLTTEKTKKTEEKPKQKTKKEDDKPVKKSKSK
jgi:hypothetical protein